MASLLPDFSSCKETTNYARLSRLLVDGGAQVLRKTFNTICPPPALHIHLSSVPVNAVLQSLKKKKVLKPTQWDILFPTIPSSVSSQHFDITLLMVLLRNICWLAAPPTGWDNVPVPTDVSLESDIARIKHFRNVVFAHVNQASVNDTTFNNYWQDIRGPLVRLGGADYEAAIDKLKVECMDPEMEDLYIEQLKQWKRDEDNTNDKLEEIIQMISQLKTARPDDNIMDMCGEIKQMLSELKTARPDDDTNDKLEEIKQMLSELKTARPDDNIKDMFGESLENISKLEPAGSPGQAEGMFMISNIKI